MYKKWILFTENHPYKTIFVTAIIGSVLGITIEYMLNRDFIGSAFYTVLFLCVLEAMYIKIKRKK